jgi:5-methylcytosine-specific restriction endonuclease McrA
MRRCSRCKIEKSENEFSSGDYRCRECNRERAREYREKYPDRVKKSQEKYNKTNKAKERAKKWYKNNGKEYQSTWASANPDKIKESRSRYYAKNIEKIKLKDAKYRSENPEKRRATVQASYIRHREKELYRSHLRRHQKSEFVITKKELRKLYSQPCAFCGSTTNQSVDHIIPFSRGGRYSIGNLQTLCLPCNIKKANRTIMEWRLGRIAQRKRTS